jgi:predicted nucleic acid-binding protein
MKGVEVFFDTNVIIYFSTNSNKIKQTRASALIESALEQANGAVSAQVMQECANVLGGKFAVPAATLDRFVANVLRPLYRIDTTSQLIESAIELRRTLKYSFYDSLIIAGAIASGAKTLYSEDLHHGQHINDLTIINPFI